VQQLFTDPAVTRVQADPSPANTRAIRCDLKAGFACVGEVTTPDGQACSCAETGRAIRKWVRA